MMELISRDAALLPCPFCGGEASASGKVTYNGKPTAWWADKTPVETAYYCNCIRCGANARGIVGGSQTVAEAIEKWNRRALPAQASAVKVKPLVWNGFTAGSYRIEVEKGGIATLLYYSAAIFDDEEPEHILGGYLSLVSMDDLKAAAQADYESRILSALDLP